MCAVCGYGGSAGTVGAAAPKEQPRPGPARAWRHGSAAAAGSLHGAVIRTSAEAGEELDDWLASPTARGCVMRVRHG
jgi:hypothetical protein